MYSASELRIISHFGYQTSTDTVEPLMMYRMLIEVAFERNDTSKYAEALRAAWSMYTAGKPRRLSQAFERKLSSILDTQDAQPPSSAKQAQGGLFDILKSILTTRNVRISCVMKRMDGDWESRYVWETYRGDTLFKESRWEGFVTVDECLEDLVKKHAPRKPAKANGSEASHE